MATQLREGKWSIDANGLHAQFSTGALHFTREQTLDSRTVAGHAAGNLLMFRSADGTVLAVDRTSKCVYLCIETMSGGFRLEYAGALPLFKPAANPQPDPTPNASTAPAAHSATAQRSAARSSSAPTVEATEPTATRAPWSAWKPIAALREQARSLWSGLGDLVAAHRVQLSRVAAALVVGGAVLVGLLSKRGVPTTDSSDPRPDAVPGQKDTLVQSPPPSPTEVLREPSDPAPPVATASAPAPTQVQVEVPAERVNEATTEVATSTIPDSPAVPESAPIETTPAEALAVRPNETELDNTSLTPLPEEVVAAKEEAPIAPAGRLIFSDLIDPNDQPALGSVALTQAQGHPLPIVNGPSFSELVSNDDRLILGAASTEIRLADIATATMDLPESQGIPLATLLSDEDRALLGTEGFDLPAMQSPRVATTRITMPLFQLIDDADQRLLGQIALFEPETRLTDSQAVSPHTIARSDEDRK